MENNGRRKFTKEFKEEALRLVMEGGKRAKDVGENLGIRPDLISRWKHDVRTKGTEAFPGKGKRSPKDEEFHQLQKELADVRMERDILKKAVAIFSRQPK